MDEENKGFPIPAKKPMFDEGDVGIEVTPVSDSDLFMVFANDAGDKAVILTPIEAVGDEVLERHGREELKGYADTLFETGDDPMELQVGSVFEGENAEADAKAEAMRLDEQYNPGEGADDAALAMAVDDAKADVGGAAEPTEPFPEDMGGPEEVGPTEPEPVEEAPEEMPEEEEPMLGQLKKKMVK